MIKDAYENFYLLKDSHNIYLSKINKYNEDNKLIVLIIATDFAQKVFKKLLISSIR